MSDANLRMSDRPDPPKTGAIYAALAKIMQGIKAVPKDATFAAKTYSYMYRSVDALYNGLHQLFADNKVIVIPTILEGHTSAKEGSNARFTEALFAFRFLSLEDGSWVEAVHRATADDLGDKGINKCLTNALKYVLLHMFLIPTGDVEDSDKESISEDTTKIVSNPAPIAKHSPPPPKKSINDDIPDFDPSLLDGQGVPSALPGRKGLLKYPETVLEEPNEAGKVFKNKYVVLPSTSKITGSSDKSFKITCVECWEGEKWFPKKMVREKDGKVLVSKWLCEQEEQER